MAELLLMEPLEDGACGVLAPRRGLHGIGRVDVGGDLIGDERELE